MSEAERRKSRRFPIKHAAVVRRAGGHSQEISAVTENASLTGVLLFSESDIPLGTAVEVTILLQNDDSANTIRLNSMGTVVRVKTSLAGQHGAAVSYHQPLESP
jgi:hypothetical protein